MKTEKDILRKLIERYERSVLSRQGSTRMLKIRFDMRKDMPEYFELENFAGAENVNAGLKLYEHSGWVDLKTEDSYIAQITLNTECAEDICRYLNIRSSAVRNEEYRRLFEQYRGRGLDVYVLDVLEKLEQYRSITSLVYDEIGRTEDMLKGLEAILQLDRELPERVFSAAVYGNSKRFAQISSKTAFILKHYFKAAEESEEDVLASFNIIKNPSRVCVKGTGSFRIGSSRIFLGDFSDGFMLSSEDIRRIDEIEIPEKTIMTIENLTPFYRMNPAGKMLIYLGGYHNHVRRELLNKIYKCCPETKYLHFGDIDAGGFEILDNLILRTGIHFQPYCMDCETLRTYQEKGIPLTEGDRERLTKMMNLGRHREIIAYMLKNNIKLEQENIRL